MERCFDSAANDGLGNERSPLNGRERLVIREENFHINMRRLSVTEVEGVSPSPPEHMLPPGHDGDAAGSEQCASVARQEPSVVPVHCHGPVVPADPVARNQLIAISVLCFVFMVAEVVGEFSPGLAFWTSFFQLLCYTMNGKSCDVEHYIE